jgi:predicted DNA-binding protein
VRTTIELRNDQRARLLELAARRGEKGFSAVIREAVDHYLKEVEIRDRAVDQAVEILGSFREEEAEALRERVAEARRHWR